MSRMDETRRILETIAKPSNRSSLFWWMLEHHDEVLRAAGGGRLNWKQICEEVTAFGLTNVSGGRVTEATARKTWFRVRREKARRDEASKRRDERQAALSEARAKERSLSARAALPPVVERGLGAGARRSREDALVVTRPDVKPWDDPNLTPEQRERVKAELERIERREEWNDRRVKKLSKERFVELAKEFAPHVLATLAWYQEGE